MWCCIEFGDACCRKRFSLSLPDGIVPYSDYNPIAVQGLGAGAITSSVHIILSDIITLRERGTYGGLMGLCVVLLFLETC
jgi:MFS family permease